MLIEMIPLNKLVPSPVNVRKTGINDGIGELAANIAALGLLQNLQVRAVAKWVRVPAIAPAPIARSVNFPPLPPPSALRDLHAKPPHREMIRALLATRRSPTALLTFVRRQELPGGSAGGTRTARSHPFAAASSGETMTGRESRLFSRHSPQGGDVVTAP